jgi:methanogenic corrinoid protein MtbC1
MINETIYERLIAAIIAGDKDELLTAVEDALRQNIAPMNILDKGMSLGMKEVGERYICLR